MKPLSLAILGCGDLTRRTILPHLAQDDARALLRVEAVCDLSLETARQLAEQWNVPAYFDDFDTLLRECDAEAVAIVVPPELHAPCAIQALESGRHVYVQKPLASSVAAADALLVAAQKAGKTVVSAPGQALWPLHQKLRALIQEGLIGAPYIAQAGLMGWGGYELHHGSDPTWCFSEGSGPLRDHGVYSLATLTYLLGQVERVQAMGNIRATQRLWQGKTIEVNELDNLALTLQFSNGALGLLAESWCSGSDPSSAFRINGLEGVIEGGNRFAGYHGIFPLEATLRVGWREPEILRVDPDEVPFLAGEHRHFQNPHIYADLCHLADVVREGVPNLSDGQQGRHIVQIVEAAHETARHPDGRTL